MKKRYLMIAGIATVMQAMLFGCGAVSGEGTEILEGTEICEENTQAAVYENDTSADGALAGNGVDGTDADGVDCPTTPESETQLPRMVMLDGKLYVETDETNSMLRCGVMDGNITSTTEGEMPTEDGQSNFGKDIGYQYGMRENRIEIYLDDAWRIFAYNENNLDGVSMTVKDVTASGCTVVFSNELDHELTYGEDFSLEKLDPETKEWTYVPIVFEGDWGFNQVGYCLAAQSESTLAVDWSWLYGSVEPGTYRIVKSVLNDADAGEYEGVVHTEGSGNYVKHTLSCEFHVPDVQ